MEDTLFSDYYTGRDRSTHGTMNMHLVSYEVLDREDAAHKYSQLQEVTGAAQ